MKKRCGTKAKKKLDYPEETEGSRMAREMRKRTNALTKDEREELFKQAMQVYYGGSWSPKAARS